MGRLWEALGALGKATDRPPDRPTDYIYKLPINRSSGPILVVVVVVVVVVAVVVVVVAITE